MVLSEMVTVPPEMKMPPPYPIPPLPPSPPLPPFRLESRTAVAAVAAGAAVAAVARASRLDENLAGSDCVPGAAAGAAGPPTPP